MHDNLDVTKVETMKTEIKTLMGKYRAVPAYNIFNKRSDVILSSKGKKWYIISFNGFNVYIAGDTENTLNEIFKNIDIAFLPMNLLYDDPEMVLML